MPAELKVFTAADLKKVNPQAPEFVVEGILPCGFTILAAPPKIGKSWLCLTLADAVAEGLPFFSFQTNGGSVLYLALEDSSYRLNSRLQTIGSRMTEALTLAIRGAATLGGGLLDQLRVWADAHEDARLVVIDTVGRVKGSSKPGLNAYEADTQLYAPLQEFAVKRNMAIVGVSHFSKPKYAVTDDPFERITGSTGAFGVADAAWVIYGKRGEEQTLRITGRDVDDQSFRIRFNSGHWQLLGASEEIERQRVLDEYRRSGVFKTIRALVEQQGFWEGSSTQLLNEVWLREKSCTIASTKELGQLLRENRDLMSSVDGIGWSQGTGGRKGRNYRFAGLDVPLV